jgi:ABC-2 type transport system ATP-binding protein
MELFNQVLALKELLDVPVRKLSLGQRMRCDLAAALLHNPPILFLDEPTIGLDVVAKDSVRQFLRAINFHFKTTVLLTTHDLDDIEELCRRIMIIDRGTVLYDGALSRLKEQFLRTKQIKFILRDGDQTSRLAAFEKALPTLCANRHPSTFRLERDELTCRLRFDRNSVSSSDLIRQILAAVEVRDFVIEDEPIEEIIKRIYSGETDPAATNWLTHEPTSQSVAQR